MSVLRHPSPEVLLDHAAGRLARGATLLVQAHLSACPACRAEVGRCEAVGGVLLEALPDAEMAPDALDRALALIGGPPEPPPPAARTPSGIDLSSALDGLALGPKKRLAPGLWLRPVMRDGAAFTYLLRSGPGGRLPRHSHSGAEYVCVLKGAYTDETGRYGPGDFAEGDQDLTHSPLASDDGECLCLIFADGPIRFEDAALRAMQPLIGI